MQKQKFDLEKALAGAPMVAVNVADNDRVYDVSNFRKHTGTNGDYMANVATHMIFFFHHTGLSHLGKYQLFMLAEEAEPPTPPEPMLSAEEWYRANIATARISTTIALMQQYGSYVADYINKNK
jgi:hypothetical protein